MKPSSVVLSLIFGIIAAVGIVYVGRYTPLERAAMSTRTKDVGPPIAKTGPYPKAVVDKVDYDFGTMSLREKGTHTFTIRNDGQSDLVLMARPEDRTCQCTAATLSSETPVSPGGSVDVTLNWEIKSMSSEFRHSALIRTNDPENKTVKLEIMGKVEDSLMVIPPGQWEIGELNPKGPTTFQASMHSPLLEDFTIEKLECANPLVSATWEPMSDEKKTQFQAKAGYEVLVTVAPGSPIGHFSERLTFHTSDELHKEVTIPVHGTRPGPIEFFGAGYHSEASALLMGEFPAKVGKEVTLSVIVRDFDGELQLTDYKQQSNTVKVEFARDEKFAGKNQRYQLKIIVPPGEPQDRQRANSERINLFFNHPEAEQVRMRIDFLAS